jgi:PAS domain S-box-containing protein
MFRELFDTAADAMVVVDHDGRIVRANPQAEHLFGFSESELHGQPIEVLMPEHARHRHHAHREGYRANPRVRPMGTGQELTGLKRNGQQFPVEIALSPINTPDGRLFLAAIRDISETQRARQALVRAHYDTVVAQIGQLALAAPNLDTAIENTPELVAAALSVQAVAIVFKHVQFKQMQVRAAFGIQAETINGLPWSLVLHDSPRQRGAIAPLESTGGADQSAALSNEPSPRIAGFGSTAIVPLFDLNEPMGALLALSHERRSFDHDAMHFLQSVANLLAAAMQRMRMEEQLSHAQRLEAIGQLTGGVAHDFNNLLTVISGNLQILEDELTDRPAAREVIGSALRAVGRGAELTRKLLAFARRQRLSPRASDPKKLLSDLGAMLRRTLGETINLEISYRHDIARVFADPGQLDGALVNLALNSRDAMPRGGDLDITASHQRVSDADASDELKAGDYVVFAVRDTGLGMTPEVLARAFEPFFTTKEQGKGSGLGLSMVYGFVKQSGGHLSVDSQLGYGTCIKLHLPAAEASATGSGELPLRAASRGNETILVVEDEPDVRDIAIAFLSSLGYSVVAAADAENALKQLAKDDDIAMVFSDVVLGTGMTGVELAEQIKHMRPGLPVLLTSGYEHSAAQTDDTTFGQFELLQKPYRREELSLAVRRTLDQRRSIP